MAYDLTIGGVKMPDPALEGISLTSEKIWSSNAGRSSSGKMLGTVVAIKRKLQIKWNVLSMAQVSVIEAAVSNQNNPFVTVSYTDMTGATVSMTAYFGTPSYTVYSYADGIRWVKGVTVDAIEQ